jgi:hypothetical protein
MTPPLGTTFGPQSGQLIPRHARLFPMCLERSPLTPTKRSLHCSLGRSTLHVFEATDARIVLARVEGEDVTRMHIYQHYMIILNKIIMILENKVFLEEN